MSRKKHVDLQYLQGDVLPPHGNQLIAQSLGSRGGNTLEVQLASGDKTLCLIPSKFNKTVWIRKGGLVIIEQTVTEETAAKVTGTVMQVLYDDHIKSLRKQGVKIPDFGRLSQELQPASQGAQPDPDQADPAASDSDSMDDIPQNMNRRQVQHAYSESDSDQ